MKNIHDINSLKDWNENVNPLFEEMYKMVRDSGTGAAWLLFQKFAIKGVEFSIADGLKNVDWDVFLKGGQDYQYRESIDEYFLHTVEKSFIEKIKNIKSLNEASFAVSEYKTAVTKSVMALTGIKSYDNAFKMWFCARSPAIINVNGGAWGRELEIQHKFILKKTDEDGDIRKEILGNGIKSYRKWMYGPTLFYALMWKLNGYKKVRGWIRTVAKQELIASAKKVTKCEIHDDTIDMWNAISILDCQSVINNGKSLANMFKAQNKCMEWGELELIKLEKGFPSFRNGILSAKFKNWISNESLGAFEGWMRISYVSVIMYSYFELKKEGVDWGATLPTEKKAFLKYFYNQPSLIEERDKSFAISLTNEAKMDWKSDALIMCWTIKDWVNLMIEWCKSKIELDREGIKSFDFISHDSVDYWVGVSHKNDAESFLDVIARSHEKKYLCSVLSSIFRDRRMHAMDIQNMEKNKGVGGKLLKILNGGRVEWLECGLGNNYMDWIEKKRRIDGKLMIESANILEANILKDGLLSRTTKKVLSL